MFKAKPLWSYWGENYFVSITIAYPICYVHPSEVTPLRKVTRTNYPVTKVVVKNLTIGDAVHYGDIQIVR